MSHIAAALFLFVLFGNIARADEPPEVLLGATLFADNCVECHGEDGSEGPSGDIRGSDLQQVRMATGGIEEMPEFEFSDDEVKALTAYLISLKN